MLSTRVNHRAGYRPRVAVEVPAQVDVKVAKVDLQVVVGDPMESVQMHQGQVQHQPAE